MPNQQQSLKLKEQGHDNVLPGKDYCTAQVSDGQAWSNDEIMINKRNWWCIITDSGAASSSMNLSHQELLQMGPSFLQKHRAKE